MSYALASLSQPHPPSCLPDSGGLGSKVNFEHHGQTFAGRETLAKRTQALFLPLLWTQATLEYIQRAQVGISY